eukprot:scaffold2903_cov15-Tisochrysis_lutea.AAC.1
MASAIPEACGCKSHKQMHHSMPIAVNPIDSNWFNLSNSFQLPMPCAPSIHQVRAQRRLDELKSRGGHQDEGVTFEKVLQDMQERDRRDRERAAAPLKAADDAVIIDTS